MRPAAGTGGWIVHAAAAAVLAAAVFAGGGRGLGHEDHWIRWVDAAAFLFAGIAGAASPSLPALARALALPAGALLAADELAMLHECMKAGPLSGLHSARMRDLPVLAYGVAGLAGIAWIAPGLWKRPEARGHLAVAAAGVCAVLAADVLGLVPRGVEHLVEEGGELFAPLGLGMALALDRVSAGRVAWLSLLAATLAAGIALAAVAARPGLCPRLPA